MAEIGGWGATVLMAIFAGAMVVVMIWDLASFEIPDTVSLVLIVSALVGLLASGGSLTALFHHLLAGLGAFVVGLGLFALGQWGGGDVKVAAAVCFWLGWPQLVAYGLVVAVAGGLLALTILLFRAIPLPSGLATRPWLARLHRADQGLPYGIALGGGGLFLLKTAVQAVGA